MISSKDGANICNIFTCSYMTKFYSFTLCTKSSYPQFSWTCGRTYGRNSLQTGDNFTVYITLWECKFIFQSSGTWQNGGKSVGRFGSYINGSSVNKNIGREKQTNVLKFPSVQFPHPRKGLFELGNKHSNLGPHDVNCWKLTYSGE